MDQRKNWFGREMSVEDRQLRDGEQQMKLRSLQDAARKMGETMT